MTSSMKHTIVLFCTIALIINVTNSSGQESSKLYKTNAAELRFFSETPLENIEAISNTVSSAINPSNRSVAFVIVNSSFQFENSLMKEHFNEKYMESNIYPRSTFSGTINENINLLSPGTYSVTVTGKLMIHGIEQNRTVSGKIIVGHQVLSLSSDFDVKLIDHKIEVPQIVFSKIAETIHLKVLGDYNLK